MTRVYHVSACTAESPQALQGVRNYCCKWCGCLCTAPLRNVPALACLQVLEAEPEARVLLAAPANYSADLLASALAAAGISPDELLRLNDPRRPINQARA